MMVILNALTIYHSPLLTIAPNVIKLSLPLEGGTSSVSLRLPPSPQGEGKCWLVKDL